MLHFILFYTKQITSQKYIITETYIPDLPDTIKEIREINTIVNYFKRYSSSTRKLISSQLQTKSPIETCLIDICEVLIKYLLVKIMFIDQNAEIKTPKSYYYNNFAESIKIDYNYFQVYNLTTEILKNLFKENFDYYSFEFLIGKLIYESILDIEIRNNIILDLRMYFVRVVFEERKQSKKINLSDVKDMMKLSFFKHLPLFCKIIYEKCIISHLNDVVVLIVYDMTVLLMLGFYYHEKNVKSIKKRIFKYISFKENEIAEIKTVNKMFVKEQINVNCWIEREFDNYELEFNLKILLKIPLDKEFKIDNKILKMADELDEQIQNFTLIFKHIKKDFHDYTTTSHNTIESHVDLFDIIRCKIIKRYKEAQKNMAL